MVSPAPPPQTSIISPAIFYWGTPVVLISTLNPPSSPSTTNIAPLSSAFWLSNHCILGLGPNSQSAINLLRTKQCVLNLPSSSMSSAINLLARTTGSPAMTPFKHSNGYSYVSDKFLHSNLTAIKSDIVEPERVQECPVQMEAILVGVYRMHDGEMEGEGMLAFGVKIVRTHVHDSIRMEGSENRIDPDKWRPMIMSFQQLYGLEGKKVGESVLAGIEEEAYRDF